ncbi:MAG: hybrid sensor histidine kinase/response regulator [Deltaproteobacteria bacterium HGW-Deltaproteobacteria-22]|nr:MAG: hybrid sensor histidine kinase/response regulator [Deltaproteobacteria bacterium HGW-Deltaproteobacteria-22]
MIPPEQPPHDAGLSESTSAAIIENTLDNIWAVNRDYEILYLNEVFCRAFQATFGVALTQGTKILDTLPEPMRLAWKERYDRAFSGERFVFIDRIETGGEPIHVEVSVNPILNQGQTMGAAMFARDITHRIHAEQEQASLEAQLQQAQKMEAIGRLAGGVAHDLNNMLGAILGFAELALQAEDRDRLEADLHEIRKAANRSADLTRQLLTFARRQAITPQILDLNHNVGSLLRMLRRIIGEDIEVVWEPAQDLGPVWMDPSQLDQILTNLCVNARDAITAGGRVTIQTTNRTLDEAYCTAHPEVMPGDYAVLTVRDNGCGMDDGTLSRLFEPFFTTKAVGKGTGLGLATVHGIVRQNGGHIAVRSAPGEGTTFGIFLPLHVPAEKTQPPPTPVPAPEPSGPGSHTILLVEDEPAILRLTRKMLEKQGYAVLSAGSPMEALQLARHHAGGLHLLLTDVIMPGMNGRELATQMQELQPDLRILFMSGYTADIITRHDAHHEDIHFLQKPFSIQELLGSVRRALGH